MLSHPGQVDFLLGQATDYMYCISAHLPDALYFVVKINHIITKWLFLNFYECFGKLAAFKCICLWTKIPWCRSGRDFKNITVMAGWSRLCKNFCDAGMLQSCENFHDAGQGGPHFHSISTALASQKFSLNFDMSGITKMFTKFWQVRHHENFH